MSEPLRLDLYTQRLATDAGGHATWVEETTERVVDADRVAVVICDMWDNHWSRGAAERVDAMVERMDTVVARCRAAGMTIIHAPSDTLDFYAGTSARRRALAVPVVPPPADLPHDDPPLPIDDSDEGSDTGEAAPYHAWSRQHPGLHIDETRDFVTDKGHQVYSVLRARGIEQVLIMGVHTNMCILNRSFGIKQLVRWGVPVALVRDLTDAMYNPARSPYVSHAEGTRLVIEYIARFWCPTVTSDALPESSTQRQP